ncbi:MAG: acyl--CoA ligase [Clostridiales bacterium]|nr:acyl--CoA ligase [Clostridiales bacterium]
MYMYDTIKNYYKKDLSSHALLYMGKTFTYAQLFDEIDVAARKLGTYVKAGDVVTVCMPNTPECVFCFYALNRIGAIVHMVHPLAPLNQIKKFMAAAKSKLLVTLSINLNKYAPLTKDYPIISVHPARTLGLLKRKLFDLKVKPYKGDMTGITDYDDVPIGDMPPEPVRDGDSAGVYLNSGGTGGEPKIIELSDNAINALGNRGLEALNLDDARGMYMLAVVPMSHGYGLTMGVHTTLTYGAVSVLMPKFDAKLSVKLIKKNKLHFLVGVPNLFRALLKQKGFNGKALRNIYVGYIGGDVAPQSLLDEFNDRLKSVGASARLFEGYGLTETTNVCVVNNYKYNRRGSLGKPFMGLTAAIAKPETDVLLPPNEKGEILIAGDTLMIGYLNNPEETAKAFTVIDGKKYVRTGDFGYMDGDGFLYFVQRLKRIIKISGMSVFPRDIEASALKLDGVTGACAVEYKDNGKTKIALYLTGTPIAEQTVKDKIATDLSHYAMPTIVEFIDKIPLTPIMKADTLALSARANATVAGEIE